MSGRAEGLFTGVFQQLRLLSTAIQRKPRVLIKSPANWWRAAPDKLPRTSFLVRNWQLSNNPNQELAHCSGFDCTADQFCGNAEQFSEANSLCPESEKDTRCELQVQIGICA